MLLISGTGQVSGLGTAAVARTLYIVTSVAINNQHLIVGGTMGLL